MTTRKLPKITNIVDLYHSKIIIAYSKIEISNEQLLDKFHKMFSQQNKSEDLPHEIIVDLF